MVSKVHLNQMGLACCAEMVAQAAQLGISVAQGDAAARVVDCGVVAPGGLQAGVALAEVCMAGLGQVQVVRGPWSHWSGASISVVTDQPVAACLASQYAGWPVQADDYFAMASGPMRAARGREELLERIGFHERVSQAVGILESGKLPTDAVCQQIAAECQVDATGLTLLVARTASLAGGVQVVARSIETTLHKMVELDFDIQRVRSGFGIAPLPPVAGDDLQAIGRTNDAVLYGAEVTLWVTGDDDSLAEAVLRIPSSSSADHGAPFGEIFARYNHNFYDIDADLFSPASVTLVNCDTGHSFQGGALLPDVLRESFS